MVLVLYLLKCQFSNLVTSNREVQGGLQWELLYVDDLVLMAESEAELKQKRLRWKTRMKAKGDVSREVQGGLQWELLYVNDLVPMAESEAELKQKTLRWKTRMKAKGLKVSVDKIKVID